MYISVISQLSEVKYNKELDSNYNDCLLITFKPHLFSFPLRPTSRHEEAQILPPLVKVGTRNHASPSPCEETLTPVPNHHKTPSQSPYLHTLEGMHQLALSVYFWTCL